MVSAPTLYPDQSGVSQTELNFFIYYRKADGWIVGAPGWPMEYAKRLRQGWTPLPQYGQFTPGAESRDTRGVPFAANREGWRVGFQRNADAFAREFKPEQIIAYNWHHTPPYKEVAFPQIEGMDIPSYECPECVRPPLGTVAGLSTHLRVMHDYSRVDLREFGKEIGVDFTPRSDREQAAELAAQEYALTMSGATPVAVEFKCDVCSWAPPLTTKNKEMSLSTHKRMAHERTRVPDEPAVKGES